MPMAAQSRRAARLARAACSFSGSRSSKPQYHCSSIERPSMPARSRLRRSLLALVTALAALGLIPSQAAQIQLSRALATAAADLPAALQRYRVGDVHTREQRSAIGATGAD